MDNLELQKIAIKNKRQLKKAVKQINLALNLAIKVKNEEQEYVQVRLLILIWMSYAETHLLFFATKQVFSEAQTQEILSQRSEIEKWHYFLDSVFKIQYLNSKQRLLNRKNLGHKTYNQYETLKGIIDEDVAPFIQVRNRLAHGQWSICLNNDLSGKRGASASWRMGAKISSGKCGIGTKSMLTDLFK